jgi:hypothetical protein
MKSAAPVKGRKPFAFDPRLAIGLALVVASVAGVVAIVSSADETVRVYAAAAPLAPGDRIETRDLVTSDVRLDKADSLYLLPGGVPSGGVVITRAIARGELIPLSAIGSVEGLTFTSLVLTVDDALAVSIDSGSTVDVWAAREGANGTYLAPAVVVSAATVVRLVESRSIVAGGKTVGVEVLVPKDRVARMLEALANDDAISIVPSTLPGRS